MQNYDKKDWVRLCRMGCKPLPIHGRDPTTARRGAFCLLRLRPGPVQPALDNLDLLASTGRPILTPCLVWTPDLHRAMTSRNPVLKPSTNPGLPVAGLQESATAPSR